MAMGDRYILTLFLSLYN